MLQVPQRDGAGSGPGGALGAPSPRSPLPCVEQKSMGWVEQQGTELWPSKTCRKYSPKFLFLPSHPPVLSSPLQPACEKGVLLPTGEVWVILWGKGVEPGLFHLQNLILILSAKRLS